MRLRLSLNPNIYDTAAPVAVEKELQDWADALRPSCYAAKDQAPVFSPAEFAPGYGRLKESVRAMHAVVLDLDHVPLLDWRRVTWPLLADRACIVYSSWSHATELGAGRACVRVILPLSRPCVPAEWDALWTAVATRLGGGIATPVTDPRGPVDPSSKTTARAYYVPAYAPGSESAVWFHVAEGAPLDVDAMLTAGPGGDMPTGVVLGELAERYARRRTDASKDMGGRLRRLARGEPYADPGERDDATWRLACVLAREFPDAPEVVLAATLEPSLEAMRQTAPDSPSPAQVRDKVRRAIEATREDADRHDDAEMAHARALLRAAGRERCYEPEEISALMRAAGARDAVDLQRRWVLQDDGSFYLLEHRDGRAGYTGPFTTRSLPLAAEIRLAAAQTAGVVTWTTAKSGERKPLPGAEVALRYGSVVDKVVTDFAAQASTFDGRVLTRAPCPMRRIEPRHSPVVEAWLAALCGEALPRVLDWLAVVKDVRRECAALYLFGGPGTGKSLLSAGLARIWTEGGAPSAEDALGGGSGFNSRLLDCPLVVAEESVPKDFRGHVRTEELRAMISARVRTLRAKYVADGELRGAIRLILTANNQTLLQAGANLTQEDIEAIAERLLYVRVQNQGRAYLESLPRERIEALVHADEIAAHVLWLAETRVVAEQGRFRVAGGRDEVVKAMTVAGGLRSAILNWVVLWLLEPSKLGGRQGVALVHEGEVLVSGRGIQEAWSIYETNYRSTPNASEIRTALVGVCRPGTRQVRAAQGERRARFWVIDQDQLAAWCEHHAGYAEWEELQERIKKASEPGASPGPWGGAQAGWAGVHP